MTHSRVAERYALALIELAEEQGNLTAVEKDMEFLAALISASREFAAFLRSPVINHHRKQAALTEILKGKVDAMTLRFVVLLAAKDREGILLEVVRHFRILCDVRRGIVQTEVRTVVPMTAAEQETLTRRISAAIGKTVRLTSVIDPSLRGGFTVRFNDTVWDASVRRRLEVLRHRFTEGIDPAA